MKYFVYAKIENYLYRQRVLPENLNSRLNFVSFFTNSQERFAKIV